MPKKILVIDDESQILQMVCRRLAANGYEVISAASGAEGIQKAKSGCPDLILLDQVMFGMQGDEVLDLLKKNLVTRKIPVIIFTADVKQVRIGEYQLLGAADCLYKPFTSEELLSKIRKILGENS